MTDLDTLKHMRASLRALLNVAAPTSERTSARQTIGDVRVALAECLEIVKAEIRDGK